MARRVFRLGPGECSNVETGARYFAALAFPGAHETAAREKAVQGWVASYLHEANIVDHCDEPFEDQRLNELVQLSPAWCKAKLRTTRRRLEDRSTAARAVRPWVLELQGQKHPAVAGIEKFTQRQMALYLCGGDVERAANFQKRIWRPSRPVLHLAIAQDRKLLSFGENRTVYETDLMSAPFIGELVDEAAQLQAHICGDKRFGVTDEQLLHLEWVP